MLTVGDLDALLVDEITPTLTTSQASRMAALNYGRQRLVAAVRTVRPERFLRDVVCTLPANRLEIALNATLAAAFGTSIPHQLLLIMAYDGSAPTLDGTVVLTGSLGVTFVYASIESQEYRNASRLPASSGYTRIFYDFTFPNDVPTLAIAPALSTSLLALVRYYATPARYSLTDLTRQLGSVEEQWDGLLRAWAMERLLRKVNDAEASAWAGIAETMRQEMLVDIAMVTRGGHQTFGDGMRLGDE